MDCVVKIFWLLLIRDIKKLYLFELKNFIIVVIWYEFERIDKIIFKIKVVRILVMWYYRKDIWNS